MRFRSFHVEGFGLYHDARVVDLPRLGVFTGANESGKTTLLEFLRFVLFGDRSGSAGAAAYPPLDGGRRGGRLAIETASGGRFDVERLGSGRTASLVVTGADATAMANPEAVLADLLGGLDRAAYERIFAVGAAELEGLGLLDDRALVRQLAAAAAGTPALPSALARLDREIGALLKGERARAPRVNAAFLALDEARARQRALAGQAKHFAELSAQLDDRHRRAGEWARDLERERRDLEDTSRAQPLFDRLERLLAQLEEPVFQSLPVNHGVSLAVLGMGLTAALATWGVGGAAMAAWGVVVAAVSAAALYELLQRQARSTRRKLRIPLEAEIEEARRELTAKAATTDPAEFAAGLARRRARLRQMEEQERALQREIGSLENEVDSLGRDSELEAALADGAAARTELDRSLDEWARRALCRELLERARARHEAERRPRVLAAAERFLRLLLGTEEGAFSLVGDARLALRDEHGTLRGEGQWSSGLADQIFLAVRLGFAQELAGIGGDGPPLVLDDVHLRFDPARRRGLARALAAFARTRQVLVFSCQPELAADFVAEGVVGDEVGYFTLDRGRIERSG